MQGLLALYTASPLEYAACMYRRRSTDGIVGMFADIAGRYDLMNTLMSFGMDKRWRKRVVRLARLFPGAAMLDVGAGTGRITLEAARSCPGARIVALDITPEMMAIGRRITPPWVSWDLGGALRLPFPDRSFDAVTSGFMVRNVPDASLSFSEQLRVLKPGGTVVCLDAGPLGQGMLEPLARFHLERIIPWLGAVVTGHAQAYRYLPDSTKAFMDAERTASLMRETGFVEVGFERYMLGAIFIVHGRRPLS